MDSCEGVTIVVVAATQGARAWTALLTKRQVRVQARRVAAADLYPTKVTFTPRRQILVDTLRKLRIFSQRIADMHTLTIYVLHSFGTGISSRTSLSSTVQIEQSLAHYQLVDVVRRFLDTHRFYTALETSTHPDPCTSWLISNSLLLFYSWVTRPRWTPSTNYVITVCYSTS
jgi:hypothetical protein